MKVDTCGEESTYQAESLNKAKAIIIEIIFEIHYNTFYWFFCYSAI